MIGAAVSTDLDTLLAGVAALAAAQAEASAREAVMRQDQIPLRWRDPSLLWPAFVGGRKG